MHGSSYDSEEHADKVELEEGTESETEEEDEDEEDSESEEQNSQPS